MGRERGRGGVIVSLVFFLSFWREREVEVVTLCLGREFPFPSSWCFWHAE